MIEIKKNINILYLLCSVTFSIIFILLTIIGSIIIVLNFIKQYFKKLYFVTECFNDLVCTCRDLPPRYISTPTEPSPIILKDTSQPQKLEPIMIRVAPEMPVITLRDISPTKQPITIREEPIPYKPITIQDTQQPIRIINIPAEPIPIPTEPVWVCETV